MKITEAGVIFGVLTYAIDDAFILQIDDRGRPSIPSSSGSPDIFWATQELQDRAHELHDPVKIVRELGLPLTIEEAEQEFYLERVGC